MLANYLLSSLNLAYLIREPLQLYKYVFTLDCLPSHIHSHSEMLGIDFSIIRLEEDDKPSEFYFTSDHINSLNDPLLIWARGLFLLSLYKGAYHLGINPLGEYEMESRLQFIRLLDWKTWKNITPFNPHLIVPYASFDEDYSARPLHPYGKPEIWRITNLVFHSRSKTDVRTILMQLGNGLDWINLYSILDSVKTFSKKISKKHYNKVLTRAGFTQKGEKKFTGTANNFGLLSTRARHGHLNYTIPSETMNLKEAQDFVIRICNSYLYESHNL